MKSEKGITLTSLVIYIVIMTAVMALLGSLSNFFYQNLKKIDSSSISSEEFNKFNTYFVKDVKNSKTAIVQNNGQDINIIFENGSKYTYVKNEKAIYKGAVKIARNIVKFNANITEFNEDVDENEKKTIIDIEIGTGTNAKKINFNKNIKYVLKYW